MIGMRSNTYMDGQLVKWGIYKRWLEKGGTRPGPKRVRSWWGPMITDRLVQGHRAPPMTEEDAACPVDIDEARDMDVCVAALGQLDDELHMVVLECWYRGGTSEQQAEACRCSIGTYYRRLERAKEVLLGLLQDHLAGGITVKVRAGLAAPTLYRSVDRRGISDQNSCHAGVKSAPEEPGE